MDAGIEKGLIRFDEDQNFITSTKTREIPKDTDLEDYSIFMAIAEDLGYDVTDRDTKTTN